MGLCVCVSKNQKNQRGTKKKKSRKQKSVEHGDLKIKINSGFQNSELYRNTRDYHLKNLFFFYCRQSAFFTKFNRFRR